MNKVYILFPLIGILIFGGFYVSFDKSYAAKEMAIKQKALDEKAAKAKQQIIDREGAIKSAVEAQAIRKKEREEKEKIDEAKKTARQEAEDRRSKNYEDRNRFRDQVSRLKKELTEVKEVAAKAGEEKKRYSDEVAGLQTYVKQAESNVKYYTDLLEKISSAEKAAADAAAAAAATAKKS